MRVVVSIRVKWRRMRVRAGARVSRVRVGVSRVRARVRVRPGWTRPSLAGASNRGSCAPAPALVFAGAAFVRLIDAADQPLPVPEPAQPVDQERDGP
jgi:hypothetical protein